MHIAIIPDGNRRFAKRLMETPSMGYEWGIEKLKEVFEWGKGYGIRYYTFYALSLENLDKRPKDELDFILSLAKTELDDIVKNRKNFIHKNHINVRFIGRTERLPGDVQSVMETVTDITRKYSDFYFNIAVAYGGRQEIIDACRSLLPSVNSEDEITEKSIMSALYTNGIPEPDLIIRTGGEKRLSNFLLFQSAYSELAFVDSYWPEFSREEFDSIIKNYSDRQRRYGK